MLLNLSASMTESDSPLMNAVRQTHAGMAHYAGTGPAGRTCRECVFWMTTRKWNTNPLKDRVDEPADATCKRFRQLAMKRLGSKIPHDVAACRYFEESPRPQPIKKPTKS